MAQSWKKSIANVRLVKVPKNGKRKDGIDMALEVDGKRMVEIDQDCFNRTYSHWLNEIYEYLYVQEPDQVIEVFAVIEDDVPFIAVISSRIKNKLTYYIAEEFYEARK